jgi:hypothetical protein
MAINFLQSLFDPARSVSMPFNPASAPVPQFQGSFQQMTQGAAPPPARETNILQAIGGEPDTPAVQTAPAEPPRKRRSFLDTIGQISDVLARVGGAEALYQPTLDARENHAREIDLEEMRKQLLDQQLQQGRQTLAAGENELADTMRGRAATALGALAQNPDAGILWSDIAAQAGLDEQTTAQIGGLIERGISPQVLAQSLGGAPESPRQGSQVKEVQIYQMLQERDPEAAQAYLQSLANPDSMNPYQAAQLDIALQRLGMQREALDQGNEFRDREIRLKEEKATSGSGGAGSSKAQARAAQLPAILNAIDTLEASITPLEQGGWTGPIGGYVPSSLDSESDVFETNLGLVRQLIRGITKVEGEGSISDYETKLQQATLPGRTQTPEGRKQAIKNLRQLVKDLQGSYASSKPASAARPAPARRGSGQRIMPRTPAGQRPTAQRNPAVEAELRRRGLID